MGGPPQPPATSGEAPLDPGWERDDVVLGARISDLIAGLDTIGAFVIPFARLPRRLGTYTAEFPCWADVADQTPRALLTRPKLGAAAVRALILAGRAAVQIRRDSVAAGAVGAVAAVTRLVEQLDDFDRAILSAQDWALDPGTQREVAERCGVHQVSVGRNLPRARARFAELLADPVHHEVCDHADELRRRLGPYLQPEVARAELRRLGLDPSSLAAEALLHVAGPYARRDQWLESTAVAGGGAALADATVDAAFFEGSAPATSTLLRALTTLGIPPGVALAYLEKQALRRFGDLWVRWPSPPQDTTGNMAEAVLHVLGVPATSRAILDTIGPGGGSVDNMDRVLSLEDRFIRASRRAWGLRAWGLREYVSIAHAIGKRIDAAGGTISVAVVTADLLASYPDITATSIRTNLSTLGFVTKDGVVRRRTTADGWPPVPPLRAVRGAFHNGDEVRVAVPVTSELLRGSGQALHGAVATAAGVTPGQQRTFTGRQGELTVSWSVTSTHGATLGSLRAAAAAVDASAADTLVVALRKYDQVADVTRLGPEDVGLPRLRKLLGRAVRKPTAALAASLRCLPDDVDGVLRARGDDDLAGMLTSYTS
jgi:hypothetical protein